MRRRQRLDLEATTPAEREFSDACESFLHGAYADHLRSIGRPIPAWTWLNVLAHGTETQVRAITHTPPLATGDCQAAEKLRQALVFLAGEVLDHAERIGGLGVLQRSVLIPLELQLVDSHKSLWLTTGQLVGEVYIALDEHSNSKEGRRTC